MPTGPVRDAVSSSLLLLLSQPPEGASIDPETVPRLLVTAYEQRNEARDLYLGLLAAYVTQGPELPKRSLEQWPDALDRPPELIEDMVGVLSSAPRELVLRWWESVTKWKPERDIAGVEAVAPLARLAENLWSDDDIENVTARRQAAARELLRLSEAIRPDQANTQGNLILTKRIAEWLEDIPIQWARKRCGIEARRITTEIIKYIYKVEPKTEACKLLMLALTLEQEENGRWHFHNPNFADHYVLGHALLDKGLSDIDFINANAPEVIRVLAATSDALELKHQEESAEKDMVSYFRESDGNEEADSSEAEGRENPTGDLVEDFSQIWFWESDIESDLRRKLAQKILNILEDTAEYSDGDRFGQCVDAAFDTSNLVLLRTLVGEVLYRATKANQYEETPTWLRDRWLTLIADWRLYQSYSMTFWLRYGLHRFFGDLEPSAQQKVLETIRAIASQKHGEGFAACYASDIADHLTGQKYEDLLTLVTETESIPAPRHPRESRRDISERPSDHMNDFDRSAHFEKWDRPEDKDAFLSLYEAHTRLRDLMQAIRGAVNPSWGPEDPGKSDIEAQLSELTELLRETVAPMEDIMESPEHAIDYEYPLGFASVILRAISSALAPGLEMQGNQRPLSDLIEEYAPWVNQALKRTEQTILEYVPAEHREKGFFEGHGWPDTMICAFEVLDVALLPDMPEKKVRKPAEELLRLVPTVSKNWPLTTRCHFSHRLRAFHWAQHPDMYDLLDKWIGDECRAPEISALASVATRAYRDRRHEIVRIIIARSDIKGDREQLDNGVLGPLLGQSWYFLPQSGDDEVSAELAEETESILCNSDSYCIDLLMAIGTKIHWAYCDSTDSEHWQSDPRRYGEGVLRTYEAVLQHKDATAEKIAETRRQFGSFSWWAFKEENCSEVNTSDVWEALHPLLKRILDSDDWLAVDEALQALWRDETADAIPPGWEPCLCVVQEALDCVSSIKNTTAEPNDLAWGAFASGRQILNIIRRYYEQNGPPGDQRTRQRLRSILTELTNWPAKADAIQLRQEILRSE